MQTAVNGESAMMLSLSVCVCVCVS